MNLAVAERPFGLTRVTQLTDQGRVQDRPETMIYDPELQLNVCPFGVPTMAKKQETQDDHDHSGEKPNTTHKNTQYDHQWVTDTD